MYNSDLPSRADLPSSRQLLRSTLMAAVIAVLLLVTVILPAEYGIDPTGVGGALGLAEMGEIKQQLAREAEADAAMAAAESSAPPSAEPTSESSEGSDTTLPEQAEAGPEVDPTAVAAEDPGAGWREEFTMTFAPAQGDDIKLVMSPGDTVQYEWTVDRGHLNSDLHTDNGPDGRSHSYRQGRAETEVADEFTAITEGTHGWFWRNRSDEVVTVTLRVRGTYRDVRR